jgi:hypothetical protein
MHDNEKGADRTGGTRAAVAQARGAVVRHGMMVVLFLLAHSLLLALAISLFAAD